MYVQVFLAVLFMGQCVYGNGANCTIDDIGGNVTFITDGEDRVVDIDFGKYSNSVSIVLFWWPGVNGEFMYLVVLHLKQNFSINYHSPKFIKIDHQSISSSKLY